VQKFFDFLGVATALDDKKHLLPLKHLSRGMHIRRAYGWNLNITSVFLEKNTKRSSARFNNLQ